MKRKKKDPSQDPYKEVESCLSVLREEKPPISKVVEERIEEVYQTVREKRNNGL